MRVLILGIASTIGRKLTARLMADGHEVIGIDARPWGDAPRGVGRKRRRELSREAL